MCNKKPDKKNTQPAGREPRRFVVLHHTMHPDEADHFDLMIQNGDHLATWRVAHPPEETRSTTSLTLLAPHRLAYLDYEGAVSGNRGQVRQHDSGTCHVNVTDQTWHIMFFGQCLTGSWTIQSTVAPKKKDAQTELRRS